MKLVLWMPDETSWLTVRNVLTVEGRPVPDGQNRLDEVWPVEADCRSAGSVARAGIVHRGL
jgi:hypothetical protein